MISGIKKIAFPLAISITLLFSPEPTFSGNKESLLKVTINIKEYSTNTVKPELDSFPPKDSLSALSKIVNILLDPEKGIHSNKVTPNDFFAFDKLYRTSSNSQQKVFLQTFPKIKRQIIKQWHSKFMLENPADVFFAPSADEIICSKAAFGCTHFTRAFIAVVKSLRLIENPEDLRYVVSCRADDYNKALQNEDYKMTINGHQFALVKINSKWIAINTTVGEFTILPEKFSPESCVPPRNIPIEFESYKGRIVFLLRKIGKDYHDDCGDGSLSALMNISRSGNPNKTMFAWEKFETTK